MHEIESAQRFEEPAPLPKETDNVPECWYHHGMDWFFYLSRRCSYITAPTKNSHLCLLVSFGDGEQVGFKICDFSQLPEQQRYRLLEHTGVGQDAMWCFEKMQKLDAEEKACVYTSVEAPTLEQMCS